MYIPFSFLKPQRATVSLNGLRIWNTFGGYNSSSGIWQDISGNNNTGSVLGSTLTEVSGGYLFDGTTNFVLYNDIVNKAYDVPDPLLFNMTISVFGTFSTDELFRYQWFGWKNVGVKGGFFSAFDNINNPNEMPFVATAGGTEVTFRELYSYTENEKAMFTIVVNGQDIFWYKNTQLFASASYVFDQIVCGIFALTGSYPLRFGASGSADTNKFSGSVSNLLMYNTSLTANEIANNYTYLSSI